MSGQREQVKYLWTNKKLDQQQVTGFIGKIKGLFEYGNN